MGTLPQSNPSSQVMRAYSPSTPGFHGNALAAYRKADSDYNVVCPARVVAKWVTRSKVPAYLYHFTHGPWMNKSCPIEDGGSPLAPNVSSGWAIHGSEQSFVFG